MVKLILLVSSLSIMTFCTSFQTGGKYTARILSEQEATSRANAIENVRYNLNLNLDRSSEIYDGTMVINFGLKKKLDRLRVDFKDGILASVKVNAKKLKEVSYDKSALLLPSSEFRIGDNVIEIEFSHAYSKSGSGLHRFIDPEDKRVYLYSDFQPFDANEMFPCFDQPDLKANFTLTVNAPKNWEVITSVEPKKILKTNNNKIWQFDTGPIMSSYLFAMHAGPYKVWKDHNFRYPLRVLSRRSLAKHVKPNFWFKITKQGFDFFEKYFGVDYPYKKYDQVIVPEFNAGAMENIAAVTFNEWYVKKSVRNHSQNMKLANVILHEMAHMWFGNLVTMRWWNGLWLNESFATYMASLALVEGTEFKDAWLPFHFYGTARAYQDDQKITTHPIEVTIANTSEAFANFDRITYGKGAAVMKQLHHYIGKENFRRGLENYFKKHQNKNTEINDFLGAMERTSGLKLDQWSKFWLETANLNKVAVDWSCDRNNVRLFITQSAPKDYQVFRPHKIDFAFYKAKGSKLKELRTEAIVISQETMEIQLQQMSCPEFVFINHKDHGYLLPDYSREQKEFVLKHLASFPSELSKTMLWTYLWQEVLEGRISLLTYLDAVLKFVPKESSEMNKYFIAENMSREVLIYLSHLSKKMPKTVDSYRRRLESLFWREFTKRNTSLEMKTSFFDAWSASLYSSEHLKKALSIIEKNQRRLYGVELDPDRRWSLVIALNKNNYIGGAKLIEDELKRDSSDRSQRLAIAAEVIRPDDENKEQWFKKIVNRSKALSMARMRMAMISFFQSEQLEVISKYSNAYLEKLNALPHITDERYQSAYTRHFYPLTCQKSYGEKVYRELNSGKFPEFVTKNLKYAYEKERQCVRVLEAARSL